MEGPPGSGSRAGGPDRPPIRTRLLRSTRVGRTLTYLVELGVGLACLAAAALARGRWPVSVTLAIAGLAAAGHATVRLLA